MASYNSVGRLLRLPEGTDVMYGDRYYVGDYFPQGYEPWRYTPWPGLPATPNTTPWNVKPFVFETEWRCPKCGVTQLPSEARAVEIIEPGKNPRVEFHGRIRPSHDGTFSCLVCGHTWGGPPEDPTPGGSAITFLHPITECDDECDGQCCDRDAC